VDVKISHIIIKALKIRCFRPSKTKYDKQKRSGSNCLALLQRKKAYCFLNHHKKKKSLFYEPGSRISDQAFLRRTLVRQTIVEPGKAELNVITQRPFIYNLL